MKKKERKPSRAVAASDAGTSKKTRIPDASEYLRRLRALGGVDEEDYAMFSDDVVPSITEFIPTGSLAIDKLINGANGGWPIGGISECAAWEHVGKSTLLDQSIAHCQRMDGVAFLIDSEKGRDLEWTELLGVNTSKLITYQAATLEEAFLGIEQALTVQAAVCQELVKVKKKPPPMLIVWDSLGGTPSKAELEGEPDDKHMAVAARVIKMNFRRLTQRLASLRCALVFSNHYYNKIGGYGGLETYGGSGVKYHTDLRLWLAKPEQLKIGDQQIGHIVRATGKKNRVSGQRGPVDTALIYGAGMDNSYTLFEWGRTAKNTDGQPWIVRNGAWFWLYPPGEEPISFQRMSVGLGEVLASNHAVYQTMANQYLAAPW